MPRRVLVEAWDGVAPSSDTDFVVLGEDGIAAAIDIDAGDVRYGASPVTRIHDELVIHARSGSAPELLVALDTNTLETRILHAAGLGFDVEVATDRAVLIAERRSGDLYFTNGIDRFTRRVDVNWFDEGAAAVGGRLLVAGSTENFEKALFAVDPADGATAIVARMPGFSGFAGVDRDAVTGGRLLFGYGGELWTTDGTEAGTAPVPVTGADGGADPVDIAALDHQRAVFTRDGPAGAELWVTDGTGAGTRKLADLAGELPPDLVRVGGRVAFESGTAAGGEALWATDGTEAGTRLLTDARTGDIPSAPQHLTAFASDRLLFFTAEDGRSGREPWVTDGTPGGTHRLADVNPGPASSILPSPQAGTAAGSGELHFVAESGVLAHELWVTDGTSAGTRPLAEVGPVANPLAVIAPLVPDVVGGAGRDTLSGDRTPNRIEGRAGHDVLTGGRGDDVIAGGGGRDVIDGGSGFDTAEYLASPGRVIVNLQAGRGRRADAAGDRLHDVENVGGSPHPDVIWGNDGANALDARAGADVVRAFDGADVVTGGQGDDRLDGGAGADTLDGGNGTDEARYDRAAGGVAVDLEAGRGSAGWAEGDVLLSVEDVTGSPFDDTIAGAGGTNILQGLGGDDSVAGGGERDYLYGNAGDDTLIPGEGDDRMKGGRGADVFVIGTDDGFNRIRGFERTRDVIDLPDGFDHDDVIVTTLSWGTRIDFWATSVALLRVTGTITEDHFA